MDLDLKWWSGEKLVLRLFELVFEGLDLKYRKRIALPAICG